MKRLLHETDKLKNIKANKEMALSEYCIDTFGFDPLTPEGQQEFAGIHQPEIQQAMKHYPNKDEQFYTQMIIQDLVINDYLEFANHRGFEPIMDEQVPSGGVILNNLTDRRRIKTSNSIILSIIKD